MADTMLGRGNLLAVARSRLGKVVCATVQNAYKIELTPSDCSAVTNSISQAKASSGVSKVEMGFPAATLLRFVKPVEKTVNPVQIAEKIFAGLDPVLGSEGGSEEEQVFRSVVSSVSIKGAYVNFGIKPEFVTTIVDEILNKDFLKAMPPTLESVMVEYSQPNTHKAFHVGHMRNVALGDSISRIYKHLGYKVIAANYFGDEGAHVAKCLWLLQKRLDAAGIQLNGDSDEETIGKTLAEGLQMDANGSRGEYLGLVYAQADNELDLRNLTKHAVPGVIAAKVLSIDNHPENQSWKIVKVQYGQNSEADITTVVCAGVGYKVNDVVAYAPVGIVFNKTKVIPKDMKGIESCGLMVGYGEAGEVAPADMTERAKEILAAAPTPVPPPAEETAAADTGKKSKKKAKKKKEVNPLSKMIWILDPETESNELLGKAVTEIGRLPDLDVDASTTVDEELAARKSQVSEVLQKMEAGDPLTSKLWSVTKKWSLDEFKSIYSWLGAHFDHDFFESEVSAESKELCLEYFKKGLLVELEGGAIGANLDVDVNGKPLGKNGLGVLVLVKSDGNGLYATKDLALASRKFREFGIDKSIYVVDSAQELHFKQVFETLKRMEFEQASKCVHVSYGRVVLPEGNMSSRKGNVVYFSQLKQQLADEIESQFLNGKRPENVSNAADAWEESEIAEACRVISGATIRYRMLNVEPVKGITFSLQDWTAKSGDTGPYILYTYAARCRSILSKVPFPAGVGRQVKPEYLSSPEEQSILMRLSQFWATVERASGGGNNGPNPAVLCKYAYELASEVNAWYTVTSVKNSANDEELASRLLFVEAISEVMQTSLGLLGISTVERM